GSAVVVIFTTSTARSAPATRASSQSTTAVTEEEMAGQQRRAVTTQDAIDLAFYRGQRQSAIERCSDLLAAGTNVELPEPIVNNAWRTLLIAQYGILAGNQMNYSALNQYARQYANESGDSIRSLMFLGHQDVARRAFKPLFVYL